MSLSAGTRLDQYEIVSSIGAGGMGEVYRAKDTRLGRDVAIKVLPQRFAKDSQALERFEREAKALAALSHPNILTIFDFGSDQNVTYAVMELLEGETLRNRIGHGQLSWNKILEIALAITEGLSAAHSRGIIHRDLKPENIFLTNSGGAKILDFGLARLDSAKPVEGESKMVTVTGTEPGTVLGTVGYMSPEQVRGQALDSRTDIFSLGVILYEMATGKCPFARNTAADTMAAILNHDPAELSASGNVIPPEFDRVILHCLEKNPDHRFQSSRDLAFDLKEVSSGIRNTRPQQTIQPAGFPVLKVTSIAVLILILAGAFWWYQKRNNDALPPGEKIPVAVADFVNETGEKDLDGLSGMLITSLEQSKRLAVMTRSRMLDIVKQMGKETEKIDENLGRELCKKSNTSALILASIRKFDQLYTIDLKVLDPQKNEYLFTTKQQGNGKASVPDLIDKLSEETRKGLNERATEIQATSRKVTDVTTSNLEAYQHYFQGEALINNLKFEEAEAEFEAATKVDPGFALAYLRMAYAISWLNLDRAKAPMEKAIQMIDRLPEKEKLMTLASRAYLDRDLATANKYLDQSLALFPNEKEALFTKGDLAYHFGNPESAVPYFKRVLDLDPRFERALQHLIWAYSALDQNDLAVKTGEKYVELTKSGEAFLQLFQALMRQGNYGEMEKLVEQADKLFPGESGIHTARAEMNSAQLKIQEAIAECKIIQSTDPPEFNRCLSNISMIHGMYQTALESKKALIESYLQNQDRGQLANAYAEVAYIHFLKEDRAAADQAMNEALKYTGAATGVLHAVFDTLCDMNRIDEALEIGKQNLWGHRAFYEVNARAFRSFNNHDFGAAVKDLEYLTLHGFPADKSYAFYTLGRCYMGMKKYDDTIRVLNQMLSFPVSRSQWHYGPGLHLLAQAYDAKGDRASATETYKRFLQVWSVADPDLPQVIQARARLR